SGEGKVPPPHQAQIELEINERADHTCQQLGQWISNRDFLLTVAATPAKQDIAQYGHVIVTGDGLAAVGATRAGMDYGLIVGYPGNTNVEETSDREANQDTESQSHRQRSIRNSLWKT